MDVGILGLQASGKTTLFNLLTGQRDAPPVRRGVTMGVARVPDSRLDELSAMYKPRKHTPATVRYADVPGLPEEHRSEGSLNLPELRMMDAMMVVLRAFSSDVVAHPMGSVDPIRDLEHLEEEFMLQDQIGVERRLERLAKDLAKRRAPELEAEQAVLRRCLELLENQTPLRAEDWNDADQKLLRGFAFLSLKPLLAVVNLDESEIGSNPEAETSWDKFRSRPGILLTSVCATLEGELAEMEAEDAATFMEDLGLEDRALDRVIRASYDLLGLISFFTVGEDECRAWSVRSGTIAQTAGGVIHSDIERGFIRAEVVPQPELVDAGSLAACRDRGTLRLEGKTYAVTDGDVIHFRFNV